MGAIPQCCQAILTALYRDTALLRPPYIGIPPSSDRRISRYRHIQTALYRDTALFRPPYIGIPPSSDCRISRYRIIQTALYRDTALFRPPYIGTPPYSDRLIGTPLMHAHGLPGIVRRRHCPSLTPSVHPLRRNLPPRHAIFAWILFLPSAPASCPAVAR